MNNVNDLIDLIHKTTLTFSCPLALAAWLKHTQRNRSTYIVEAIEARRKRDEEDGKTEQETT